VLAHARNELSMAVPVVSAAECQRLRYALSDVSAGKAFLLQAGPCAESFKEPLSATLGLATLLDQLTDVLARLSWACVVTVG